MLTCRRVLFPLLASLSLAALWALPEPRVASAAPDVPDHFDDQLVAGNVNAPTNGAFLPDGRMLVTEQYTGRIRLILGNSPASPPIVGTIDSVRSGGEAGLVGIAVDPAWPVKPYVYVQATRLSPNQVVIWRYRASGSLSDPNATALTINPASRFTVLAVPDNAPKHNGGTLRFGLDGRLYSGIGDDDSPCDAQDLTKPNGKLLRLDVSALPDGAGGPPAYAAITPAGNPFLARPDSTARLVWAYGLRNPFAFEVDRVTGCLIVGDVGNESWEEVDRVCLGGMNLGWPLFEGPMRNAFTCTSPDTVNLTAPIFAYPHVTPGWAIVGGPAYHAPPGATSPYPASFEGTIFAGDTWRSLVKNIVPSGPGWAPAPAMPGQPDADNWETGASWITHLEVGPDGALWYTSLESEIGGPGEVRRIVYYAPSVDAPAVGAAAGEVRLAAPWPSPARGASMIAWSLPAPARVEVSLLDARGRAVRHLVHSGGRLSPAGPGRAHWDGLDDAGRAAPPGVYFVHLAAGAFERSERLVLVR